MQYEIIVQTPRGEYCVLDLRGHRPTHRAFDIVAPTAPRRTVAPNIRHAREVRDAYLSFNARFGIADIKSVVLRKVPAQRGTE